MKNIVIPSNLHVDKKIEQNIDDFLTNFKPLEIQNDLKMLLYFDKRSRSFYLQCHLNGKSLSKNCDLEATLDGSKEDEIYKLNREITEDQTAYKMMEEDALEGRTFEDLVFEYDTSYISQKPLKVYGGQHRLRAISKANKSGMNEYHGVRVYFNLTQEQKVEIAFVNNTSITVSNDLLDRMREQIIGSELRDWCQSIGLLERGEDFSDRRSAVVPTVRIARTIIVNYYLGKVASEEHFHQPIICVSGGLDKKYMEIRKKVKWLDKKLIKMGKEFSRLHELQRKIVSERKQDNYSEFARKTFSLSVVSSWAYASGLFQRKSESLENHYSLPDLVSSPNDPLNAKALSEARLKGIDPDTYRGLGTRSSPKEIGRVLEVFIIQATKARKGGITKELANAAIKSYEAKRATFEAKKALRKI